MGFAGLTIDATALYALSAPDVPQSIRQQTGSRQGLSRVALRSDAAIERAEAGEAHGEWLPWLDREFGWSEDTAQNYMRIARRFKIPTGSAFPEGTISEKALYVLSAPEVSQAVRDAAIERAGIADRLKAEAARRK